MHSPNSCIFSLKENYKIIYFPLFLTTNFQTRHIFMYLYIIYKENTENIKILIIKKIKCICKYSLLYKFFTFKWIHIYLNAYFFFKRYLNSFFCSLTLTSLALNESICMPNLSIKLNKKISKCFLYNQTL